MSVFMNNIRHEALAQQNDLQISQTLSHYSVEV